MAIFVLIKPLCGLDQNKNYSFLNWTPIVFILDLWMDTRECLYLHSTIYLSKNRIRVNALRQVSRWLRHRE